jgi:hypothetical protein
VIWRLFSLTHCLCHRDLSLDLYTTAGSPATPFWRLREVTVSPDKVVTSINTHPCNLKCMLGDSSGFPMRPSVPSEVLQRASEPFRCNMLCSSHLISIAVTAIFTLFSDLPSYPSRLINHHHSCYLDLFQLQLNQQAVCAQPCSLSEGVEASEETGWTNIHQHSGHSLSLQRCSCSRRCVFFLRCDGS